MPTSEPLIIAVLVALITSVPSIIMSMVAILKIIGVHRIVNSRLSEWKNETKEAAVDAARAAYDRGIRDEKERAKEP